MIGPNPAQFFDRINQFLDPMLNATKSWSLRVLAIYIKERPSENRIATLYQKSISSGNGISGSQVQADIEEAYGNVNNTRITYSTIDQAVEYLPSQAGTKLLLSIGDPNESHHFAPITTYRYLISNKGFRSVGLEQTEFDESLRKVESEGFWSSCVFS